MKIILLTSALLLSPAEVERLDKAWLLCQRASVGMVHSPDNYCIECFEADVEWPKDGYPQCQKIWEAERDRAVVRENAKKAHTEEQQKRISNFLDSVLDMLK
jgi:hypothetical protein